MLSVLVLAMQEAGAQRSSKSSVAYSGLKAIAEKEQLINKHGLLHNPI
jgi:hypothetical protein